MKMTSRDPETNPSDIARANEVLAAVAQDPAPPVTDERLVAARQFIADLAVGFDGKARDRLGIDAILAGLAEVQREMNAAEGCIVMISDQLTVYIAETNRIEDELESRVRQRTADLLAANGRLQLEMAERNRVEGALRARETQLLQSTKMAAVGQLAAGLAHEMNNPLATIIGFAEGLQLHFPGAEQFHMPISCIVREAVRCKNLVRELLTFSRTGAQFRQPVDMGGVILTTVHLLTPRARLQGTTIDTDIDVDLPTISANKSEMEQVFINLGNNALDALGKGGEIVMRAAREGTTHLVFEVHDTGPEIPQEVQDRMFEPFFTTKEVGKGTGLGLTLAYEVVRKHGGTIEVQSSTGKGTTMSFRLPVPVATVDPQTTESTPTNDREDAR